VRSIKKPPGVMLYFDIRPSLRRLSLEEKGQLFEAILTYGELGEIPNFDGMLGVAWDFIQPKIDADAAHYDKRCRDAKSAARQRWEKRSDADGCERIQTDAKDANSPATSTAYATSISESKTEAATAGELGRDRRASCAEYPISEEEFNSLRNEARDKLVRHLRKA
jgi:hypothetical protein